MPERPMFSRWDTLNPTNLHTLLILGWAFSVYHRPHLPDIRSSYAQFDNLIDWAWWGWIGLAIALLLILTPRSSGWRCVGHGLCATYWGCVSSALVAETGVTGVVITYTILALSSTVLFSRTVVHWQSHSTWWRRLVACPPRWLRRLAGVDEFEHEARHGRD